MKRIKRVISKIKPVVKRLKLRLKVDRSMRAVYKAETRRLKRTHKRAILEFRQKWLREKKKTKEMRRDFSRIMRKSNRITRKSTRILKKFKLASTTEGGVNNV